MTATRRHVYRFLPGLRLAVTGEEATLHHFDREYGPGSEDGSGAAEVVLRFDPPAPSGRPTDQRRIFAAGGHKSVRWTVALGDPAATPLTASITIRGWPRSFALSLVQGYFVETLISLAAPAAGHALVPAAALVAQDQVVLMLGPSGAGKSSLSARLIASGGGVVGDDQVLVNAAGQCSSFPRRMRFYPDLADTAPDAFRALRRSTRLHLRCRGLVDRLTAGYVRPSLAIQAAELDPAHEPSSGRITRVIVLEPRAPVRDLESIPEELSSALSTARRVFELQRARLWSIAPSDWRLLIRETAEMEDRILTTAFRTARIERVRIPAHWEPKRSIDALAVLVGTVFSANRVDSGAPPR
jgi:hypothetical protein